MRKAHAPALLVETQQVVAELVRLRRPQLADRALVGPLVGKYFAHDHTPSAIAALRASLSLGARVSPASGISSCTAQS